MIITFMLLMSYSSVMLGDDSFKWMNFLYRPLADQPDNVELFLYNKSGTQKYPDLIEWGEDDSGHRVETVIIPETVYDESGTEYSVISIWGESATQYYYMWVPKGTFQLYKPDTIYLPKTIVWIGNNAFDGSLIRKWTKRIYLQEGIEHIGDYAFAANELLDSIVLPNSLKQISNGIFSGCVGLKTLTLPNRPVSIGHYAFRRTGLESIDLPSSIESIGEYAFSETPLKSVILPSNCTFEKGIFKDCSQLESVLLPVSLTELPEEAFLNCKLSSINIPDSLQTIGKNVFGGCPLSAIVLPHGLQTIAEEAFSDCDYLRSITVKAETPPVVAAKNAFSNYNATIYVPRGSIEKYATSPIWCLFKTITAIEEQPVWHVVSFALPSGNIEQEVLNGETLTLRFVPDDGYQVHSVTYNDTDVTALLDSDNSFTTPAIKNDATVVVVFEKTPDGIAALEYPSHVRVHVGNQKISVSGAGSGEVLRLYNDEGLLLGTFQADAQGNASISVSRKGLYIVSSIGKNFKLRM